MNRSNYRRIILIAIAVITLLFTLQAVSMMMFASLGSTSASDRWGYILTLQIVLAIVGIAGYLSNAANFLPASVKKYSYFILVTLCGVLLGFYYGGTYTDNNSQAAVASAISIGIVFNLLNYYRRQAVYMATIVIAGVCAYGFALMRGIAAINLIAGSLLIPGIIWGSVCLTYLGLAVNNLAMPLASFAIAFGKIKAV